VPVKIESFEPMSEEDFSALRQRKARQINPVMAHLLDEVERGTPVRVPLADGQSARGLRVAIARAASGRDLRVETMEGENYVAVRKSDESTSRKRTQQSSMPGRRRGRPPKAVEPIAD
jgi:hypothetical protein